ncbi:MAG: nucleotide exchange factor GrpE [Candidatus Methanolliviera hydrocarbonicum]|uniref:Protein GrpE n=1 Tax=Candidatus Methanolliviera hydrocarbonicum TaxID=2491085 RepID=A0A520KW16_9EURY|nr:MAG: nucleotide exchange factor GrpE [Candidatus Methanolliviera hydrocarbonicum]
MEEKDKIEELTKELSKKEELYLRTLADFDNYRKRVERDKECVNAERERAILLELLEAIDNFERALSSESSESSDGENIEDGVQLIYNQLLRILERHGVTPYESVGEKFNPELHEAILAISTNKYPSGTITAEMQKGYKIGDEVLRVAKVQVSRDD